MPVDPALLAELAADGDEGELIALKQYVDEYNDVLSAMGLTYVQTVNQPIASEEIVYIDAVTNSALAYT